MLYTVGVQPVLEKHKIKFTHNPGEPDAIDVTQQSLWTRTKPALLTAFNSSVHSFGDFLSIWLFYHFKERPVRTHAHTHTKVSIFCSAAAVFPQSSLSPLPIQIKLWFPPPLTSAACNPLPHLSRCEDWRDSSCRSFDQPRFLPENALFETSSCETSDDERLLSEMWSWDIIGHQTLETPIPTLLQWSHVPSDCLCFRLSSRKWRTGTGSY